MLWLIYFRAIGTAGLVLAWLPTLFHERAGISLAAYSKVAAIGLGGSVIGTFAIGYVLDRFPPVRVIMLAYGAMVVALTMLGQARFGTMTFVLALSG